MASYFVFKSEPDEYSWDRLVAERVGRWDGVRNHRARNFLRAARRGDLVLFYHSGVARAVVGIARVEREAYPDPTAAEGDWSAVDVAPVKALVSPVTLGAIKAEPALAETLLVRAPRLSVGPLSELEFRRILALGGTRL